MTSPSGPPLLEAKGLVKRFPGVLALGGVDLAVGPGETVAVIGENGAGKSTLMKILAGVQTPDAGELRVDGRPVRVDSVRAAEKLGIALIHQELNLCDNLSVAANVFLGREPRRHGLIDRAKIEADAVGLLRAVGLEIPPATLVSRLAIGHQQMVEIAKALSVQARLLIMDEPTSSLSQRETEHLFRVIRGLRNRGVAVVYISHRLGEVREVADRVVVLRDGRNSGELGRDEIDPARMVKLMVGRDLSQFFPHHARKPGPPALEVRDLRTPSHPRHELSFTLSAGEIVGVAGLVGAGRTELLRTLFGIDRARGGLLRVEGREARFHSPLDAIRAGVAMVPEDRKEQGILLEMAVRENLSLASLWKRRLACGFLDRDGERTLAEEMIARLRIRTPDDRQLVQFLSGGNQQKVVLGKWLALQPKILLLDEPTRGVDVGAKQEIYRVMDELTGRGVAILFASSDLEEILGMSDRALIMHQGRLAGELPREKLSEESVMFLATGSAA
jgi:ribose transport system ATP-binding protein